MPLDPALEAVRQAARAAVARSSLRAIAAEIGIAHNSLGEFVREGSARAPYGTARAKLLAWAETQTGPTSNATKASYFRGKQDALMGMIQYIATQQAEIGKYLKEIDEPTTPSIEQAEAEAEVFRRLPALPPLEKKKGKRRA